MASPATGGLEQTPAASRGCAMQSVTLHCPAPHCTALHCIWLAFQCAAWAMLIDACHIPLKICLMETLLTPFLASWETKDRMLHENCLSLDSQSK